MFPSLPKQNTEHTDKHSQRRTSTRADGDGERLTERQKRKEHPAANRKAHDLTKGPEARVEPRDFRLGEALLKALHVGLPFFEVRALRGPKGAM